MSKITGIVLFLIMVMFGVSAGGCAGLALGDDVSSVTKAGVTDVDVKPIVGDADDVALGTRYRATFGKEYDGFSLSVKFDDQGRPQSLDVTATGVDAFVGQAQAANAVAQVTRDLAEAGVNVTPAIVKVIADRIMSLTNTPAPPGAGRGDESP